MGMTIEAEVTPLRVDPDGVVRVGGTRVTLDTVVTVFQNGATAEEIAQQYPSLDLADIYGVIGYYLRWRGQVDEYLRERSLKAAEVRRKNESRCDLIGVRERLLARARPA